MWSRMRGRMLRGGLLAPALACAMVQTTGFCGPVRAARRTLVLRRVGDLRGSLPAAALLEDSTKSDVPIFQMVVVFLCAAVPVAYWWFVIVPFKRREIASSKARGPLKVYLKDLAAAPERKPEKWFYDKYLRQGKFLEPKREGLTDVVEGVEEELQKLPGGGFWSFDNPIFVCLVMLGIFCGQQMLLHDVLA